MPNESFDFENAKYIFTPYKTRRDYDMFQKFKKILSSSAAYHDPHTQVVVEENAIYWNHSILELTTSIPDLKKFFDVENYICIKDNHIIDRINNLVNITRTNDYRIQQAELLDEAQNFIDNFHSELKSDYSYDMKQVDYTEELVTNLLSQSNGIAYGESHSDISPKKFLIDNMSLHKKLGVTTIYLEHTFSDTMQNLLDDYFYSEDDHMPVLLFHFLRELDRGNQINHNPYNFTFLVQTAKNHGIRIIAIDSIASWTTGHPGGPNKTGHLGKSYNKMSKADRMYLMNYLAYRIMTPHIQNTDEKDKCIVFCGNTHLSRKTYDVLGVSDLTGWPSINLQGTSKMTTPLITVGSSVKEIEADYEIVIYPEVPEEMKNQFNKLIKSQKLYEEGLYSPPKNNHKNKKRKYSLPPPSEDLSDPKSLIENLILIKTSSKEFLLSLEFTSKTDAATSLIADYCKQANKMEAKRMLDELKLMKKEFSFLNKKSIFFDKKTAWKKLLEQLEEIANQPFSMKLSRT